MTDIPDMQILQTASRAAGFTSEIKFLLDASVGAQIREWARARLDADPHGTGDWSDEYRVSSVYFDTGARDVFHRRGSYGRSKYRIRRYQLNPTVFLERKLRNGSRLSKRRTSVDLAMLPLIAMRGSLNGDGTAWFRRRIALRGLEPVCQVTYVRTARAGMTADGAVRLTLDDAMTAFASDSFVFQSQPGTELINGSMILELKYRGRVPAIFRQLMDEFRIAPRRSSKYRVAAQTLGLVGPYEEKPQTLDA